MNFEAYLLAKNIDANAFRAAEPALWDAWEKEFNQLHPNSFTAQKLYLINPLRRKYTLPPQPKPVAAAPASSAPAAEVQLPPAAATSAAADATPPTPPKPAAARPVFKPKIK